MKELKQVYSGIKEFEVFDTRYRVEIESETQNGNIYSIRKEIDSGWLLVRTIRARSYRHALELHCDEE